MKVQFRPATQKTKFQITPYYDYIGCYIPIAADLKCNLTNNTRVAPYIDSSISGYISLAGVCGFFCQIGAGIDINRISLGIGYNGIIKYGTAGNCGYIKLGIRFGK